MTGCRLFGLIALSLVALAGCDAGASAGGASYTVRDSAGVTLVHNTIPENPPVCAIEGPTLTIGETAGREEYELYRVFGARRLSDGGIVLVNQGSQELRYYDAEGVFVGRAGREGGGPGEFTSAFYLWVTEGDTVWAGDSRPWEFHVFAPGGEWVRTVQPYPPLVNSPALMSVLDDGRSILAERQVTLTRDFAPRTVTPVLRDAAGEVLDTMGIYDHGRWGQVGDDPSSPFLYPLFESFTRFDGAGSSWYLGHGSVPDISVFAADPDVVLQAHIRWTTGDRTVTEGAVAAEKARLAAQYPDLEPARFRQMVAPMISDERPVADELPAFDQIVASRSGGLWVREYKGPGETMYRWLVFEDDGRFRCLVQLPDVEVVDLGEGYVLVEQESDLGVEQVAMYDVGGPERPR